MKRKKNNQIVLSARKREQPWLNSLVKVTYVLSKPIIEHHENYQKKETQIFLVN